jgi:hypothetical protein
MEWIHLDPDRVQWQDLVIGYIGPIGLRLFLLQSI